MLPSSGKALEIASGTGQHVAWFAVHMPQWTWQPSDRDASAFGSITAWCGQLGAVNVAAPVVLDVTAPRWPAEGAEFPHEGLDAIYCANMLHIAPWATCAGLVRGAARHLGPHGLLVTYGPYLEQGVATSQGNLAFDIDLRRRNPRWGIRALEDVVREAEAVGLRLKERVEMPANNLMLVFERAVG